MWAFVSTASAALSVALFAYAAWLFGRTLRSARTPLVTQFAQAEQAPVALPDDLLRYTARLTRLWFLLLLGCCALSALRLGLRLAHIDLAPLPLFALSSAPIAAIATVFLVERAVRLRRFGPAHVSTLRTQWRTASDVMRQQFARRSAPSR